MTGVEYGVILPTIWDYIHESFNANGMFMGLTISAFSISGVISGLYMGKLSDSINYTKPILLIGNLFEIVGNFIYFIAFNKWLLLLSRFISGIGMGVSPVLVAEIAKRTSKEERTSILTFVLSFRQLGLMLGPVFNLFLNKFHFKISFFSITNRNSPGFFMFFMWIFLEIFIWFFYYEINDDNNNDGDDEKILFINNSKNDDDNKKLGNYNRIEIIILVMATFIYSFNQTALETIVTPFTKEMFNWSEFSNSLLFGIAGIEIIIVYIFVKILAKYLNDRLLLFIGFICIIISLTIGVLFLSLLRINEAYKYLPAFVVFIVIDLIALPFISASSTSLFTKLIDNNLQGQSQGIQRAFHGIGTIVGPLLAGPLIHHVLILMFILMVFVLVIFTLICVYFDKLKTYENKNSLLI
jgi:ceroid-lipofuscinosis MFS transporter 7